MPESIAEASARIGRTGAAISTQLRRMIDRMLTEHRLAERLFFGPDGKPTPAAAEWLRRLARDNYCESTTFNGDRDQMLINEGQRRLAMKILGSVHLDTERLGALTRLEREAHD